MTQRPSVSIVCPFFNRADTVKATVDSLLQQDFHQFELIIIDDGSTDARVTEILSSYQDPRVRFFRQSNLGFTATIRKAVSLASADFIAIQGAGDISYSTRLTEQYRFLHQNRDFALVACASENVPYKASGGSYDTPRAHGLLDEPEPLTVSAAQILKSNPINHGSVLMRRDIYDKVGGYRSFFRLAQDKDLWLRLSEHGKLAILPKVLYRRHIFSTDGVGGSFRRTCEQVSFSRIAEISYLERQRGAEDPVETHPELVALRLKCDQRLTARLIKAAVKASQAGTLNREQLHFVNLVFGRPTHLAITLATPMISLLFHPSLRGRRHDS